ncbi:MAG TPA: hypothetical protein VG939_15320 [Caulobacteraceae bacterium]|nr:hypothetical protein [Caulobacteraceae bacterium]
MAKGLLIGLVALAWAAAFPAVAKTDLFEDGPPLKITLQAPFGTLVRSAKTNTNPYPATLTLADAAEPKTLAIQVSARGLTRRTGGYCAFPPLWLRFDKETVRGTPFHGQKKLKLVTYCKPPADYEQRIVLEYLAYRLYNVLTPLSFRVRAAEVTYRDGPKDAGLTRFGFLLEDIDDVADRNGLDRLDAASRQVARTQLDPRATARAGLLEFMLGNLDWDFLANAAGLDCCHNSRLLAARGAAPATASAVVPVPYDWDYSGFVDSPYAGVPEGLPVDRVTQRLYRGYCVGNAEMPAVIEEFRAHRAELEAIVSGEPRLNPNFKAKTLRFIAGFYDTISDPDRVQRQIIAKCR